MLQQTRVETVVPYYERFLDRFPTLEALALADEEDVLHAWAGLGYYARARNLKRAAEHVLHDHAGQVPREPDALDALPGVGRYTAGAIRSIAFGEPAAIVDGNVTRVLARLEALRHPTGAELWALARALVPPNRAGEFNQGLMELGATVCTPRAPACGACPLRSLCHGARTRSPERFPAPRIRRVPRAVHATAALVRRRDGAVLVVRRPSGGLLGGLWELPNLEHRSLPALQRHLHEAYGVRAVPGARLGKVEHRFSHRALTLEVVEFTAVGRSRPSDTVRFRTAAELHDLPLSTLMRKSLSLAGLQVPNAHGAHQKS